MKTKDIKRAKATELEALVSRKPMFQLNVYGNFDVLLGRTYFLTVPSGKIADFQLAYAALQEIHLSNNGL